MMPEGVPGVNVRKMNLDNRHVHQAQRIEQGDGRMSVRGGVNHDAGDPTAGLLDPLDEFALDIRLSKIDLETNCRRVRAARRFDVRQRFVSVNFRLANPKHVEVWAVENQYGR